jgi:hypothetical protein
MRKIIGDMQQIKKQKKDADEREKEAKKEEKQLIFFKQYVLNVLGLNCVLLKDMILNAVEEDKKKFLLITLPYDKEVFPDCAGINNNDLTHEETSCQFIRFIAKMMDQTLDKQVFDITLNYIGEADRFNNNMKIFVVFSL